MINKLSKLALIFSLFLLGYNAAAFERLEVLIDGVSGDARPLQEAAGISLIRSANAIEGYPGGIYKLVVDSEKITSDSALHFHRYPWLKNKTHGLLVIQFNGKMPEKAAQIITLPTMDTIVLGHSFGNAHFYIGDSNTLNTSNYYFKDRLDKPTKIKARGYVFALEPADFLFTDDSPVKIIKKLYPNLSPLEEFLRQQKRKDGTIIYADNYAHKARAVQMEQLVDYAEAKINNVNYMTIDAATGTGKSYTIGRILHMRPSTGKALILTSRNNLIDQIEDSLKLFFPHLAVMASTASYKSLPNFLDEVRKSNTNIAIATHQALKSRFNYKAQNLLNGFDLVIFDEAHNLFSKNSLEMINYLKANKPDLEILFFSATPTLLYKHKSGLSTIYELSDESVDAPHIRPISIKRAIDQGANVPMQIVNVTGLKLSLGIKAGKNGKYDDEDAGRQLSEEKYLKAVLDIYQNTTINKTDNVREKYAMSFCASIEHAEKLAEYLRTHGMPVQTHKEEYERAIYKYIMSFKGQTGPKKLKSIFDAVNDPRKFQKVTFDELSLQKIAQQFLQKYPYVFADVIHSGNKKYKIKEEEIELRMLRNRFGGSTILTGADKLAEGFDNPIIEVGFFLRPIRTSNTKLWQQAGRMGRIKEGKFYALIIEFIYDKEQLLLSLPHMLNGMSYGLKNPLAVDIEGEYEFKLSTEIKYEGIELRKSKGMPTVGKKRSPNGSDTNPAQPKRQRVVTDAELLKDLEQTISQLSLFADSLIDFILLKSDNEEAIEDFELPDAPPSMDFNKLLVQQKIKQKVAKALETEKPPLDKQLFASAQTSISQINDFFQKNKKSTVRRNNVEESAVNQSTLSETDRSEIETLIDKAKRAINRARNYMTGVQMQHEDDDLVATINSLFTNLDQIRQRVVPTNDSPIKTTTITTTTTEAIDPTPVIDLTTPEDGHDWLILDSTDTNHVQRSQHHMLNTPRAFARVKKIRLDNYAERITDFDIKLIMDTCTNLEVISGIDYTRESEYLRNFLRSKGFLFQVGTNFYIKGNHESVKSSEPTHTVSNEAIDPTPVIFLTTTEDGHDWLILDSTDTNHVQRLQHHMLNAPQVFARVKQIRLDNYAERITDFDIKLIMDTCTNLEVISGIDYASASEYLRNFLRSKGFLFQLGTKFYIKRIHETVKSSEPTHTIIIQPPTTQNFPVNFFGNVQEDTISLNPKSTLIDVEFWNRDISQFIKEPYYVNSITFSEATKEKYYNEFIKFAARNPKELAEVTELNARANKFVIDIAVNLPKLKNLVLKGDPHNISLCARIALKAHREGKLPSLETITLASGYSSCWAEFVQMGWSKYEHEALRKFDVNFEPAGRYYSPLFLQNLARFDQVVRDLAKMHVGALFEKDIPPFSFVTLAIYQLDQDWQLGVLGNRTTLRCGEDKYRNYFKLFFEEAQSYLLSHPTTEPAFNRAMVKLLHILSRFNFLDGIDNFNALFRDKALNLHPIFNGTMAKILRYEHYELSDTQKANLVTLVNNFYGGVSPLNFY